MNEYDSNTRVTLSEEVASKMSLDVNISEPEEFNCIELHTCIKELANLRGIEDFEYHVDYISGSGDNFVANIFRVLIKETGKDSETGVIVKTLINTTRQELFRALHKREVVVYNEVIPKFEEILNSIDEDKRVILPECFFTRIEKGNEIIILEDLTLKGYEMDNKLVKYDSLTFDQVEMIFTELAKFHALSFIYEAQYPEDFNEAKNKFVDIIFQDAFLNKSKLRTYFSDSFSNSIKVVTDVNTRNLLCKVETKLIHLLRDYMKPRKRNVLCHGDCWINNILLKSSQNEAEATKICFIDFQAMRYACPASDIIYFLFLCTDSEFRNKYFDDLKNIYYQSLMRFLSLYDIDVKTTYPREDFETDLKEYIPFGLIMALVELRIVTSRIHDVTIDKQSTEIDPNTIEGISEAKLFEVRVNDVVKESVENGALQILVKKQIVT